MEEIKELFYQWSKETLQEDRFGIMRDLEKWADIVRNGKHNWDKLHAEFTHAVYEKYYIYEDELMKTTVGREKLIKLVGITNKDICEQIRRGEHGRTWKNKILLPA